MPRLKLKKTPWLLPIVCGVLFLLSLVLLAENWQLKQARQREQKLMGGYIFARFLRHSEGRNLAQIFRESKRHDRDYIITAFELLSLEQQEAARELVDCLELAR